MKEFIATFFLVVGALSIISTYVYFRAPEPFFQGSARTAAVGSFGLAFVMLATAGALMFAT